MLVDGDICGWGLAVAILWRSCVVVNGFWVLRDVLLTDAMVMLFRDAYFVVYYGAAQLP
jgi:hypothetical protein